MIKKKHFGLVMGIWIMAALSITMTLINIGFSPMLFQAWLSIYFTVFSSGYIISLLITPLAFKLTTQIVEH